MSSISFVHHASCFQLDISSLPTLSLTVAYKTVPLWFGGLVVKGSINGEISFSNFVFVLVRFGTDQVGCWVIECGFFFLVERSTPLWYCCCLFLLFSFYSVLMKM